MKKKILVLASTFPRWKYDSVPSFVYDLESELSEDFDITVLAPHHDKAKKKELMGKIKVLRFAYFWPNKLERLSYGGGILPNIKKYFLAKLQVPLFFIFEYLALFAAIKRYKPDIIHAHWIIPQGFIASFLKGNRILITTVHGSDISVLKNSFSRFMQKRAIANSDFITVNSMATKNELLENFPNIADKTQIIPMGINLSYFNKPANKQLKKNYRDDKIILFVGRLSEQKGINFLVQAMPIVLKSIPDAKLLIIGEGQFELTLKELTEKYNLREKVEFLGAIAKDKLADYYKIADVCVLPSVNSEGQGLVLVEAAASGTAIIGTDVGGIKDIIDEGRTGLLAKQKDYSDLANKIIRILKDKKLRQAFISNAKKHIERFSVTSSANKFKDIFNQL